MIRIWMFIAALALPLSVLPARASDTPWQEVAPGADMRLISSGGLEDETAWIAVQLRMDRALKTYWRVPGETGIPAQVTIKAPQGELDKTIHWPFPNWEIGFGYVDYVYYGGLVLPMAVDLPAPSDPLAIEVIMGICSDICVPVKARFTLPETYAAYDAGQALRIRQALATAPMPWPGADEPFGDIVFDTATQSLLITYDPDIIDPMDMFVTLDGTSLVFDQPEFIEERPNTVAMRVLSSRKLKQPFDYPVRLTFLTANGPYELVRLAQSR